MRQIFSSRKSIFHFIAMGLFVCTMMLLTSCGDKTPPPPPASASGMNDNGKTEAATPAMGEAEKPAGTTENQMESSADASDENKEEAKVENNADNKTESSTETKTDSANSESPAGDMKAGGDASQEAMLSLARKSGCLACHAINKKIVGPAWIVVSQRYKSNPQIRERLINKVKGGGRGAWTEIVGNVAMPPYSPRVSDEDIAKLVDFVLGLAK